MTRKPKSKKDGGCFPADAIWHGQAYHQPSSLPTGEWNVMSNGRIHHLTIDDVSGDVVTGDYNQEALVDGRWDGAVLTFVRVVAAENLRQAFTGYLMQHVASEYSWRLAGVFGDEKAGAAQAGWYATHPRSDGQT